MTPIKVLHVVDLEKKNYYLANLSKYSDQGSVVHSFVTFADSGSEFAEDLRCLGQEVFALECRKRSDLPRAYLSLKKLIRKTKPDIVHTHLFDPSLIGLTAAKKLGRKTVLTRHHSDAIHKIPSPVKRRFYLWLDAYISRKADSIIAPSRMVRDILVDLEGVPEKKVIVIPYGQTTERFDQVSDDAVAAIRTEFRMNGSLAIVNVSRLYHRKGHSFLFKAFSQLTKDGLNAKLYLVGDGEYRSVLETMCRDLDIEDKVIFAGWRDDALTLVKAADIVVHPSLEDALSSAVIEALMLEKPIVATDISGVRDSLGDGRFGKIVPPEDAESLRRAIDETVAELEAARSVARDGRSYLLEYMSATRVSSEYLDIYRTLQV